MKNHFAAATLATLALAGCATEPSSSVVDQFYGKSLVSASGDVFTFSPDGTVGGEIRGEPIAGEYSATATEVCSTYTTPERLAGSEFCSTPAITGDQVVFQRRDGSQSQVYTIKG
ncbi:hypothetical protein [Yoonia sediminilitoris]|uniref:Lipoprotein n=1 Tax=Yoonia sediminilitoris TaxID=1286148 RepID=A0A2T6K1E6_9RHOB|nr:hypothetical protein [Yoonia sediminilitoris]PUB08445.1 hypothetical protein C8N45_1331 [Yoonia sediminilitoris]RCW89447.1 hypothetical protein DFP92_1331 [Yoonia sediminilitoris]